MTLSEYLCNIGQFFASGKRVNVRSELYSASTEGCGLCVFATSLPRFDQQTSFLLHRFNLTIAAHTSRLDPTIGEIHSAGHRLQIGLRRFREMPAAALFV